MKVIKKFALPALAAVLYGVIVLLNTRESVINDSDIMLYISLGMILPIVISLAQGLITGCIEKEFKKSIDAAIMTTVLIGGLAVLVACLFMNNNWIDILVENMAQSQTMSISVNDSISVGTVIQILAFTLIGSSVGSAIGAKLSTVKSKIFS